MATRGLFFAIILLIQSRLSQLKLCKLFLMALKLQHHRRLVGPIFHGGSGIQICTRKLPALSTSPIATSTSILPHKFGVLSLAYDSIAIQPARFGSKKGSKSSKSKSRKKGTSHTDDLDDSDDEDLPQSVQELVEPEEVKAMFSYIIKELEVQYTEKLRIRTTQGAFNDIAVPISKAKSMPLQYLGQISVKPPRTVLVNMTAQPQHLKVALNAISSSPLNINPRIDGTTIIIETPPVTREHREKLAKQAKVLCDECKNKIRSQLNESMKLLKTGERLFSQDDIKPMSKMISELAAKCMRESETLMKKTQARILDS